MKYVLFCFSFFSVLSASPGYWPIAHGTDETKGKRSAMEDAHFQKDNKGEKSLPLIIENGNLKFYAYGVLDGHGGPFASERFAQYFPETLAKNQPVLVRETEIDQLDDLLNSVFVAVNKEYSLTMCSPGEQVLGNLCDSQQEKSSNSCFSWFTCCSQAAVAQRFPLDGATAVVALISNHSLTIGNVGDARAVLSYDGGKALRLSIDHNLTEPSEVSRITRLLNGEKLTNRCETVIDCEHTINYLESFNPVSGEEIVRSCNQEALYFIYGFDNKGQPKKIQVTRALGDYAARSFITGNPYIHTTALLGNEEFLILACDGLWNVMSDQAAVHVTTYILSELKRCQFDWFEKENTVGHVSIANAVATKLVNMAFALGSTDNITVTIILFPRVLSIQPRITTPERNLLGGQRSPIPGFLGRAVSRSSSDRSSSVPNLRDQADSNLLRPPSRRLDREEASSVASDEEVRAALEEDFGS